MGSATIRLPVGGATAHEGGGPDDVGLGLRHIEPTSGTRRTYICPWISTKARPHECPHEHYRIPSLMVTKGTIDSITPSESKGSLQCSLGVHGSWKSCLRH